MPAEPVLSSTHGPARGGPAPQSTGPSKASTLAAAIKALAEAGADDAARERFAELVANQQRRALRIAYHYLRDVHDADEAVQDAFVKVFTHIATYREHLPFEVWVTRILINGCLDIRKARGRRLRWALPMSAPPDARAVAEPAARQPTPEDALVSSERTRQITAAVDLLPDRQRTVFTLCHIAELSTAEIGRALGLSDATVRVHLFRAVRKLRTLLARDPADSVRGGPVP
jgi:RNA polymerase sigma-70 factor (ECF subfamily)